MNGTAMIQSAYAAAKHTGLPAKVYRSGSAWAFTVTTLPAPWRHTWTVSPNGKLERPILGSDVVLTYALTGRR